jgi:hypothetical protein
MLRNRNEAYHLTLFTVPCDLKLVVHHALLDHSSSLPSSIPANYPRPQRTNSDSSLATLPSYTPHYIMSSPHPPPPLLVILSSLRRLNSQITRSLLIVLIWALLAALLTPSSLNAPHERSPSLISFSQIRVV